MRDPPDNSGTGGENDQAFLDFVLDAALEALQQGVVPDPETLAAGNTHLLDAVRLQIAHAETVVPRSARARDTCAGFEIVREIGRGGMGIVYLARQARIGGRLVALKVLSLQCGRGAREHFRREAECIAAMRDPGIVAVLDVALDSDPPAYAMEWVEGGSLGHLITRLIARPAGRSIADEWASLVATHSRPDGRFGAVPRPTYAQWIAGVGLTIAQTLARVHRSGLRHRDVKPTNILIRGDGTPALSDFGLARASSDHGSVNTGRFHGTPVYAPPEQLRGEPDDPEGRGDVFALGATLYHALALRPPHDLADPEAALAALKSKKVEGLGRCCPDCPGDLVTIIEKAMAIEPGRRYTAAELAEDLARLLALRPISARPAGLLERLRRAYQRNRTAFAGAWLGAALTGFLGAALGGYIWYAPAWAEGQRREARLTLLLSQRIGTMGAQVVGVNVATSPRSEPDLVAADRAIVLFRRAHRAVPWRSAWGDEALVLSAAADVLRRGVGPTPSALRAASPTAALYLSSPRAVDPSAPPITIPVDATARDLYALGLCAFVVGDAEVCYTAWDALAAMGRADGFVQAMLAQVDFSRRDWPVMYTRMSEALRVLPDCAFLTVSFADSAVHVGRVAEAEQLLRIAETQPHPDPADSHRRVWAEIFARTGEHMAAVEHFEFFRQHKQHPAAREGYARYLLSLGRLRDAAVVLHETVVLRPVPRYCDLFVAAAGAWWATADDAERSAARAGRLPGAPNADVVLSDYEALKPRSSGIASPPFMPLSPRSSLDGTLPLPPEFLLTLIEKRRRPR